MVQWSLEFGRQRSERASLAAGPLLAARHRLARSPLLEHTAAMLLLARQTKTMESCQHLFLDDQYAQR